MWIPRLTSCLLAAACLVTPAFGNASATPAAPADNVVAEPTELVGWLELKEPLREGPIPFAWVTASEAGPSLRGVLKQIRTVAESDRHLGLVLFLDRPPLSFSQVEAIRAEILAAREAGKTIIAFAETYTVSSYVLACACDQIVLQHKGGVELTGLAVEEMYLAGLLEKVGIQADLVQVGKFKGADEQLTRTQPTEAWSKNMDALLDDLYGQISGRIADGRGLSKKQVEAIVGGAWAMTNKELIKSRVIDAVADRDMIEVTEIAYGDAFNWDDSMGAATGVARVNNPFALFQMLFQEKKTQTRRPTLAVVRAVGPIHSGESSVSDGMFGSDSIGSRTITAALADALADENVKGVILSIDSPGGSALASEMIWQSVREVGQEKPVYVVVTGMAASGGYYIACAGDEVYTSPFAIHGSIGVVGGKMTLGGLYEKLGIGVTFRGRGTNASLFNSVDPFTPEQREQVRKSMTNVYDQFIDRIAIGRGKRLPDVGKVAEGRLFTGRQAVENGMADKIGGVDDAINDLAAELELEEGDYDVIGLPEPISLQDFLSDTFGVSSPARGVAAQDASLLPLITAAKKVLGQQGWASVSRTLDGLMLLRDESVLTLMPTAIVVK